MMIRNFDSILIEWGHLLYSQIHCILVGIAFLEMGNLQYPEKLTINWMIWNCDSILRAWGHLLYSQMLNS